MRIRFTLDIERRRPDLPDEHHPQGDVYTTAELAEPQRIGFQHTPTTSTEED